MPFFLRQAILLLAIFLVLPYVVAESTHLTVLEAHTKAKNGELPVLGYKGGIEKALIKKEKIGALNYIAKWQALRGENLDIDLDKEIVLTCT